MPKIFRISTVSTGSDSVLNTMLWWNWVDLPVLRFNLYRPDDGGSNDLCNVGKLLPDYTAQQPRRQPSSYVLIYHLSTNSEIRSPNILNGDRKLNLSSNSTKKQVYIQKDQGLKSP
jgi:hypothetical protein